MSEMRARLRANLRLRAAKYGDPMEADHPMWDDLIDAVWIAMREPTDEMVAEGASELRAMPDAEVRTVATPPFVWRAMIDVALNQAKQSSIDGGWRAIESAPKDGTLVLLALDDGDFPLVGSCEAVNGKFACARYGDVFYPQPTHWMPLPAPPSPLRGRTG